MKYLLDTSAVSELVRNKPAPEVVAWIDGREDGSLFLSVLTIGELHKGVEKLPDGKQKTRLRDWLDEDLMRRFQGRIIDVDSEVAAEWGRILSRAERRGEPVPAVDALIAATAAVHHLTVVTRNVKDMERCGVPVHCPWGGS